MKVLKPKNTDHFAVDTLQHRAAPRTDSTACIGTACMLIKNVGDSLEEGLAVCLVRKL